MQVSPVLLTETKFISHSISNKLLLRSHGKSSLSKCYLLNKITVTHLLILQLAPFKNKGLYQADNHASVFQAT